MPASSLKSKCAYVASVRLHNYKASLKLEGYSTAVPTAASSTEIQAQKVALLAKYRRGS